MNSSNEGKRKFVVAAASLIIGSGAIEVSAMQTQGFAVVGKASEVRSELVKQNGVLGAFAETADDKSGEGKCGEGKCGEGKEPGEEGDDKSAEGKCGEGKCGEGKCG